MTIQEVIKEIRGIKDDLVNSRINYDEMIRSIEVLSEELNIDFSIIYNAFYSSHPEMYFN